MVDILAFCFFYVKFLFAFIRKQEKPPLPQTVCLRRWGEAAGYAASAVIKQYQRRCRRRNDPQ